MMKYAVLIYSDERIWEKMTEAEQMEMVGRYEAVSEDLKKRGQFILGEPLDATSTSSTVRVRDGKTLVTDGPFAETKEQLGGLYVVDVPDLDAALAIAARLPVGARGLHRGAPDPRVRRLARAWPRRPARARSAPASTRSSAPSAGRILATLIAILRDFELAEESLQEAVGSALTAWPRDGVPQNPRAWLVQTAKQPRDRSPAPRRRLSPRNARGAARLPIAHAVGCEDAPRRPRAARRRPPARCCSPAAIRRSPPTRRSRSRSTRSAASPRRDRTGLPGHADDARAAPRPRQAQDPRGARAVPRARGGRARRAARGVLRTIYLVFNEGYAATPASGCVRRDLSARGDPPRRASWSLLLPGRSEAVGLLALQLLHRRAARGAGRCERRSRAARRAGPLALGPGAAPRRPRHSRGSAAPLARAGQLRAPGASPPARSRRARRRHRWTPSSRSTTGWPNASRPGREAHPRGAIAEARGPEQALAARRRARAGGRARALSPAARRARRAPARLGRGAEAVRALEQAASLAPTAPEGASRRAARRPVGSRRRA